MTLGMWICIVAIAWGLMGIVTSLTGRNGWWNSKISFLGQFTCMVLGFIIP